MINIKTGLSDRVAGNSFTFTSLNAIGVACTNTLTTLEGGCIVGIAIGLSCGKSGGGGIEEPG